MKEIICSYNAPAAIGPYSQAVAAEALIYTSGQLPIIPESGSFPSDDVAEQTKQSLLNIQAVLDAAGSDMSKVLKTTVFLKSMNDFAQMNAVYGTFFPEGQYPARSAVEVAALPMGAKVEIEAVACK